MKEPEALESQDYSSTANLRPRKRRYTERNHAIVMRRGITGALFVALIVLTVGLTILGSQGTEVLVGRLFLPVLVMCWCLFDGRVRGRVPTRIGLFGIFIAWPLGFVIYSFWSRGWRGVIPLLIALTACIAIFFAIGVVVEFVPSLEFTDEFAE